MAQLIYNDGVYGIIIVAKTRELEIGKIEQNLGGDKDKVNGSNENYASLQDSFGFCVEQGMLKSF